MTTVIVRTQTVDGSRSAELQSLSLSLKLKSTEMILSGSWRGRRDDCRVWHAQLAFFLVVCMVRRTAIAQTREDQHLQGLKIS